MKVLIFLLLVLIGFSANAGPRVTGNGGDAVVCKNPDLSIKSIELLDYYESRTQKNIISNLDPNQTVDQNVTTLLTRIGFHEIFAKNRLAEFHHTFNTEVKFLSGETLIDIPDSGHISYPYGCGVEQVAIQVIPRFPEDSRYTINKDLWDHMDNANKAGLIFHELLYRQLIQASQDSDTINSIGVRYVNSLAAADRIKTMTLPNYIRYVTLSLKFASLEIDGMLIDVKSIKLNDNSILEYCGRAVTTKILSFHNGADLSIGLDKESEVCAHIIDSKKQMKIRQATSVSGTVGIYSIYSNPNQDFLISLDPQDRILNIQMISMGVDKDLYKTEKILCGILTFSILDPSVAQCEGELGGYHKRNEFIKSIGINPIDGGQRRITVQFKENKLTDFLAKNLYDEGNLLHVSFYPSGLPLLFTGQERAHFHSLINGGYTYNEYGLYTEAIEFYDVPGLHAKKIQPQDTERSFAFKYGKNDFVLEFPKGVIDAAEFYESGQVKEGYFSYDKSWPGVVLYKKDGTEVIVYGKNRIKFDDEGHILDISFPQ